MQGGFTIVYMENYPRNNNPGPRINSALHTHNGKPTVALLCVEKGFLSLLSHRWLPKEDGL